MICTSRDYTLDESSGGVIIPKQRLWKWQLNKKTSLFWTSWCNTYRSYTNTLYIKHTHTHTYIQHIIEIIRYIMFVRPSICPAGESDYRSPWGTCWQSRCRKWTFHLPCRKKCRVLGQTLGLSDLNSCFALRICISGFPFPFFFAWCGCVFFILFLVFHDFLAAVLFLPSCCNVHVIRT